MRKKIVIITLLVSLVICISSVVTSYTHFEKIDIVGNGKMLRQFSSQDYEVYYQKVDKRRFAGWNYHIVNQDMKIKYVSETLLSYYNNGMTPIVYNYTATTKQVIQFDLAVSGSLSVKTQKNNKIFGDGLNASIKVDTKYKQSIEFSEKIDIKLQIDPGTQLNLYMYGEGIITNGVAARYVLWTRNRRGGFEMFGMTTHYQRLEITRV